MITQFKIGGIERVTFEFEDGKTYTVPGGDILWIEYDREIERDGFLDMTNPARSTTITIKLKS